MRHRKAGFKLNRTTAHRRAMLRNMAASLFEHGQITTTLPKAKALQPFVERIVTDAKQGTLHARRRVTSKLGGERNAFAWSYLPKNATEDEQNAVADLRDRSKQFFDIPDADKVERNRYGELRKAPKLTKHICENVAPRFEDRNGGYTRIIKLGKRRLGDGAEYVLIQFVGAEEGPEISTGIPSTRRRKGERRVAYFEKVRPSAKSGAAAEAPAESAPEAAADDAGDAEETKSE